MTGNKGFTIVVVALLITLCFGFLANVEETPSTRAVYNDQVNLEPLFYANSSRGSSVEFYNSIYNVTGWDNASVPETNIANQYRLPSIDTYTANAAVSYDLDTYTHTTGAYSPGNGWNTSTGGVYYHDGTTYTNGQPLNGGLGGTYTTTISLSTYVSHIEYKLNDTTYPANTQVGFKPINNILTLTDRLKVTNDGYYFNVNVTAVYTTTSPNAYLTHIYDTITVNGSLNADCAYIVYNAAFDNWELYDTNDVQLGTSPNAYIFKTGTLTGSIDSYTLNTSTPRFADPNQLVPIVYNAAPSNYAKWSNTARDESLINARVGVLLTGAIDIYPNDTDNEAIQIRNTDGIYTATIDGSTASIGAYNGLYIIFDALADLITVYGVLSFSDTAPALSYELTPFTYDLSYDYASEEITALYFNGAISGNAYIANTWVYSDPLGILWYNFNLNLTDYFSDRIYQNEGVRVTINGTTYYGESLTINNRQFSIENNRIEYSWIDHGTIYVQYKPLNGLIIDYIDNHAIVRYADGTVLDTGTINNYEISGAGSWFFSSNLYTINEVASIDINWVPGWSLDMNLTCLCFLGIMGITFMIASYYGRGTLGGFDYLIMVLAGVIAFVIMV